MPGPRPGAGWPVPPPPAPAQLRIWLRIGLQSFGGGQATRLLIHRAFVEERGWMAGEAFTDAWGLSQLPPGMNLLALVTLIGWRLDRLRGAGLALAGLLVPSVLVTALLTALYASLRDLRWTALALRGVIPGVLGIGLVMTLRLVEPPLRASARQGRSSLASHLAVLAAAAAAFLVLRLPVVVILVGGGFLMVGLGWRRAGRERT